MNRYRNVPSIFRAQGAFLKSIVQRKPDHSPPMSLTPFSSHLIADVGISTGDEGKGRLIAEVVEELRASTKSRSSRFRWCSRSTEAPIRDTRPVGIKLNLLPAGVIEPSIPYLAIGAGVVADPEEILVGSPPVGGTGVQGPRPTDH